MTLAKLIYAGVGETQAAVTAHFAAAAHMQPAIVSLDDVDHVFKDVSPCSHGANDLLSELVVAIDRHCSPAFLFVATCTSMSHVPAVLNSRLLPLPLDENENCCPKSLWNLALPEASSRTM
eukprot:1732647-Amphidinium_carterae.1